MKLTWRYGTEADLDLLAEWNHQLIHDEGHRNPMNMAQLAERMKAWLRGEYRAAIFERGAEPAAYALFRQDPDSIYLRQLFVRRDARRAGIGRAAMTILRGEIWPHDVRLTVEALCANLGAVEFWRSVGYRDHSLMLEIMPETKPERWDIYDRTGRPLHRTVIRGETLAEGEYHRGAQIWVRNTKGEFLIQQRARQRASLPGIWTTTAGSVLAGEDDRTGAARELGEELGLNVCASALELIFRYTYSDTIASVWLTEQELGLDSLRLQEDEVAAVRWASPGHIAAMIATGEFYDYGHDYFQQVFYPVIKK